MNNKATDQKRLTIGFLSNDVWFGYAQQIFGGIRLQCEEMNVNLLVFVDESLKFSHLESDDFEVPFKLAHQSKLDGLIVLSSALKPMVSEKKFRQMMEPFRGVPLVSIGEDLPGMQSVVVDNSHGLAELIEHLIRQHKRKKIAYISGPLNNSEAVVRLNTFRDVLAKEGVPVDEDLIVEGTFVKQSGGEAAQKLLSRRDAHDFDTIVCANDEMALGALDVINQAGIEVPEKMLVTGYDNISISKLSNPPLTTVTQPLQELGSSSVSALVEYIRTGKPKGPAVLPTQLLIRESCGCGIIDRSRKERVPAADPEHKTARDILSARSREVQKEIYRNFELGNKFVYNIPEEQLRSLIRQMVEQFVVYFDTGEPQAVENVIMHWRNELSMNIQYFELINKMLVNLQKILEECVPDPAILAAINALFIRLYYVFNIDLDKYFNQRFSNNLAQNYNYMQFMTRVNTAFDLDKIMDIIYEQLTALNIHTFYFVLYADSQANPGQFHSFNEKTAPTPWSRVALAYRDNQRLTLNPGKQIFPTSQLVPPELLPQEHKYNLLIHPLFVNDEHYGYIVLNHIETTHGLVTVSLHNHLSGTLKNYAIFHESQQARLDLKDMNEKLQGLDKLKNDFIANITHDFRSPLTVVLNLADLAMKAGLSQEENIEYFRLIYQSGLKQKGTIDRLLDLAKMDAQGITLQISRVELQRFLLDITNYFSSATANLGIKVHFVNPDHRIESVYTDQGKLEEIVTNIVSNAVKYVPVDTGEIRILLEDDAASVRIVVEDNGFGIEKDKLSAIFNRFEQAESGGRRSRVKGTGIGLAFAKQLTGYLHGRIWAESEGLGRGARFVIELKKGKDHFSRENIIEEPSRADQKPEWQSIFEMELQSKNRQRGIFEHIVNTDRSAVKDILQALILVVDDDPSNRKVIYEYLVLAGYRNIVLATDGIFGLEAVKKYQPDIIISDYNMPEMNGAEFHEKVIGTEASASIPFIFLSAITDKNVIIQRKSAGAIDYLNKPIEEKEFLAAVQTNIKRYWQYKETVAQANIDALSGLYNKREFFHQFQKHLGAKDFNDFSLIFMDVDHFKIFNDTYGHEAGDEVIRKVGRVLLNVLRTTDIIARYGGEEFIILLPETNMQGAMIAARKVHNIVQQSRVVHQGQNLSVTASLGVFHFLSSREELDRVMPFEVSEAYMSLLVQCADKALYRAKTTVCLNCGLKSVKAELFENDVCSKCESDQLDKGRNKIVLYGS